MADTHEKIVQQIILDWSHTGRGRLFKNHQGTAWIGKPAATNKRGALLLDHASKITFGLKIGSSDLIGWEMMEYVLNEPVVKVKPFIVPLICSIEVKTKAHPKLSQEQIDWLNNIIDIGGRAYVARESDDLHIYDLVEWLKK